MSSPPPESPERKNNAGPARRDPIDGEGGPPRRDAGNNAGPARRDPIDGEGGPARRDAGTKWPRWRVSMLVASLLLLAAAIANAAIDLPRGVYVGVFMTGYVLLAYGFFLAMAARRGDSEKKG